MRALGFPIPLYRKLFLEVGIMDKTRAKVEPLKYATGVYVEMGIARELGMTYEQYQKLPRRERRMQYLYSVLSAEKERYAIEEMKKESEMKKPDLPQLRRS